MNVELWREIDLMVKYKAEKDHTHVVSWVLVIFLLIGTMATAERNQELEYRVAALEQQLN